MGFSSQEYWSGLPFPSMEDLPNPGILLASPTSPALAGGFFTTVSLRALKQIQIQTNQSFHFLVDLSSLQQWASLSSLCLETLVFWRLSWFSSSLSGYSFVLTCRHGFLCMSITNHFCFHMVYSSPVKIVYTHLDVNESIGIKVICGLRKPFQKSWVCRIRRI